jgi:uncharacterized protein (DUF2235 family)
MSLYAIDGTTNRDEPAENEIRHTNVLRFCRATKSGGIFYERGVGTRKGLPGRVIGSVFGAGGFSRIDRLYDNVCKTYIAGDTDIDIIGFSRGAALALGLVNKLAEEGIRDPAGEVVKASPEIRFLGLWDTVASFGVVLGPFQRVNIGHPMNVPIVVRHCFHALALDERREAFTPTRLKQQRAYEVWFRGVHSDVGGGNTNERLGNISLRWMLRKAALAGVPVDLGKCPGDADIDCDAPLREPRDFLKDPLRSLDQGDRVHYTVKPRADGRCNDPGEGCITETEADESARGSV